ncbi:MAG: hypothetical protein JXB13_12910, partial [Phycisphaerae bacterium]|nr:hypothetical protein [Phycisphaerae bacterium]
MNEYGISVNGNLLHEGFNEPYQIILDMSSLRFNTGSCGAGEMGGIMTVCKLWWTSCLGLWIALLVSACGGEQPRYFSPLFEGAPALIDVTAPPYGAKGDGKTDDTQALQSAFQDALRRAHAVNHYWVKGTQSEEDNKRLRTEGKTTILYFPAGTYLVSDRIHMDHEIEPQAPTYYVVLLGEARDRTVIRLKDESPGYGDADAPREVISLESLPTSNASYENRVCNLSFDVGAGNPGAVALDFHANNGGGIYHVDFRAAPGSGHTAVSAVGRLGGISLFKDIRVDGFGTALDFDG